MGQLGKKNYLERVYEDRRNVKMEEDRLRLTVKKKVFSAASESRNSAMESDLSRISVVRNEGAKKKNRNLDESTLKEMTENWENVQMDGVRWTAEAPSVIRVVVCKRKETF